jgi:hypothetical protein
MKVKKFSNILNFFGANNTEAMDKIAKFKLNFLYFLSFSFLFRCGNNCNFGIDGCGRCVVSSISAAAGTCPGSNTGQPKWKWKTFFIYSHFQRVVLITLISLKIYISLYLYPVLNMLGRDKTHKKYFHQVKIWVGNTNHLLVSR